MGDIDMTADAAPELARGDSGPWVKYLKQLLEHTGYEAGTINEVFDATTEKAVLSFQSYYKDLPDTGKADRATWELLIWRAQFQEQADDMRGAMVLSAADNTGEARLAERQRKDDNLEAGEQVGLRGWTQVDINVIVHDHQGVLFPDAIAYGRFTEKDENPQTSDESSRVVNGVIRFENVWVPRSGWFYLYLDSWQRTPDGSVLGYVEGGASFECKSGTVVFEARQAPGPSFTVSTSEARTRGWNKSWSQEVGGTIPVVGGPSFGGSEGSELIDESTTESGEALTFVFPGKGFTSFSQQ